MNNIAILNGNIIIYWSQIIAVFAIITGFLYTLSRRKGTECRLSAVIVWAALTFVLSLLFSRIVHWYCCSEQYSSFWEAIIDYSSGGYVITGLILGTILAAFITKKLHLCDSVGQILDTGSLGLVVMLALIRLSYIFTTTWHGKDLISASFFQSLPFSSAVTDAAGNTSYYFASFFISFILLIIVAGVVLIITLKEKKFATGDVARLSLVLVCAVEIVLESTRKDPAQIHFHLLDSLNKYVSFISFSMLTCAVCMLCLLIHYLKKTTRQSGWNKTNTISVILFAAGLVGFGILEYLVQRYTNSAPIFHGLQALGSALMAAGVLYQLSVNCKTNKRRRAASQPQHVK